MLDNQEVFDIIAKHLLTQKVKSMNPSGTCMYYIPESNLRCAVGILFKNLDPQKIAGVEGMGIPLYSVFKDLYTENKRMYKLLSAAGVDIENDEQIELLNDLQTIHDKIGTQEWFKRLKELAKQYNLEFKYDNK